MMRVVFLLFAEESGLLPADSELYARAYSVGGLAGELEQRVTDARGNEGELEHTYLAWHRLLALFTAVYRGIDHPDLDLIAHDGSLFDPDPTPGSKAASQARTRPARPLAVDDRTVLHMLRAVQTVTIGGELRAVSFRTLTVEQIGYAYEGLLSYEGFRAAEVVVGLTGKDGREDEVPSPSWSARRRPSRRRGARRVARRGAQGLRHRLGAGAGGPAQPAAADEKAQAEARLYAVTRNQDLVRRLLRSTDHPPGPARRPGGHPPGALYVTESALRASSAPTTPEVPRQAGRRRRAGAARLLPGAAADRRPLGMETPQARGDPGPEGRRHRDGIGRVPRRRLPVPGRQAHRSLVHRRQSPLALTWPTPRRNRLAA